MKDIKMEKIYEKVSAQFDFEDEKKRLLILPYMIDIDTIKNIYFFVNELKIVINNFYEISLDNSTAEKILLKEAFHYTDKKNSYPIFKIIKT